ncbi:HEAT repeat domain-containing protein [Hymenobacter properus]|uniref:HEAT repeat domain-containing protein n=1 Tax=Hymenobacter properus TaxID=2791026 RepID=A0A931BK04_9BACT|nr:HEAT repeat domain-containing protein [Hymenobacter properus]MBF9143702.1 HEAT repeat domain-containing protein [Hymenobacter properus]MBR7722515.1 HEAT repeat domain-containing protein [Microvirga sp. SRT04]
MKTPELSACHELEALLPAYVERSLPAAEAERVAAHLPDCPGCQLQVNQLRALSNDLDAALPETPRTALRANFMAMLEEQKQLLKPEAAAPTPVPTEAKEAKVVSMWPTAGLNNWLRVAASVVLIATGVLLGRNLHWGSQGGTAGLASNATPNQEAHAQLARALTPANGQVVSASDRIQLVTNTTKETEPGDATVQVLLNTLNFDPNPNVRLATCEALYRLRDDPRVREGLVHALSVQTDPNVQITLIDMVVSMRVRRAVPQLEKLSKRPDALPVVRAQATAGIGKLI